MKKLFVVGFILLGIFSLLLYRKNSLSPRVRIGTQTFVVELAITDREKERGLAYRDSLAPDHGMLFLYDHKDRYSFWMKGMRFPLDFVWIDGKTVADVTPNVPPPSDTTLPAYSPNVPVDKILELPAGSIETYGIRIGDTVKFLQ